MRNDCLKGMPRSGTKKRFANDGFSKLLIVFILAHLVFIGGCSTLGQWKSSEKEAAFSFIVVADIRKFAGPEYKSSQYFYGVCEAIRDTGKGSFMVSLGDIDPPQHVFETVKEVLGENYPWYPVVGNHEAETPEDMSWLRTWGKNEIPNLVRRGPENGEETIYSFDYKTAHFVVINQYYDGNSDIGTDGDISEALYSWLESDLATNAKPFVFVFGHEPIISIPDIDNGRHRHIKNNLDAHPENNHRFQKLLRTHKVTAYICGHTHNFSFAKINGIWQLDAGHARGIGDDGASSTFLRISVGDDTCLAEVYRGSGNDGTYSLKHSIMLD